MALTPEDVVNKEFSSPKGFGRSGYDVVQVDDFLDEIVVELKRLNAENESLTTKLDDCRKGKGVALDKDGSAQGADSDTAAAAVPAAAGAPDASADASNGAAQSSNAGESNEALSTCQADLAKAREAEIEAKNQLEQAQERIAALQAELAEAGTGATGGAALVDTQHDGTQHDGTQHDDTLAAASTGGAAGVIALAQRLHDEHVKEGETKRDQLIADAQEHHDKVIGDANSRAEELVTTGQNRHDELVSSGQAEHDGLIKEATDERDRVLAELGGQRDQLSGQISHLQQYHDSYRAHLRDYLGQQLKGLDHTPLDDFDSPEQTAPAAE